MLYVDEVEFLLKFSMNLAEEGKKEIDCHSEERTRREKTTLLLLLLHVYIKRIHAEFIHR